MIFNTSTAFSVETKDVKYMRAGIHENVSLLGVKMEKAPTGILFIEFLFGKDGATLSHTEYEPTRFDDETDSKFQERVDKQVKRIMQIMKCFYTKEQLMFTADSFATYGNWVVSLMNSADKETKLRLKVVYGNSGYTTLPRYANYTFVEPMSISSVDSKIVELKIDVFTRPEVGDTEKAVKSSAEVFSAPEPTKPETDLPF